MLRCPSCDEEAASGQRFCLACGAPLARACPSCGAALPASARFCGACGQSISPAEEKAGPAPARFWQGPPSS